MRVVDRAVVLGGLLVLALIGGLLVVSAAPSPTPAAASPPPPGRVVREGVLGAVHTLDPLFATTQAERDLGALLFSGLTRLGPGGQVVPDLARSWQIGEGGRSYTFTIRDDARWHDGVPVTADDVVFTVLSLQHPEYTGPSGGPWRGVQVERIGRLVVRFRLASAAAGFLLVAAQPLVPSHLLARTPVAERAGSGFGQRPVGTGPFRLARLDAREAELVPALPSTRGTREGATNELGRGPAPTPSRPGPVGPAIDSYLLRFFPDLDALAAAFRRGDLDAAGGLPPDRAVELLRLPGVRAVHYPRAVLTTVLLNLRPERTTAFRDSRVRRAMLLALDRQKMVSQLLRGRGKLAQTPISPASFAYDARAAGHAPYDPAGASRLLAAAGWRRTHSGWVRPGTRRPVELEISIVHPRTNPLAHAVALQVAADWRRAGILASLRAYSSEDLARRKLLPGNYTAAIVDVNLGLDPDLYPLLASTQAVTGGPNLSGYQSRKLDRLLEAARAYADPQTRKRRFVSLQRSLAAELPILPLFFADYLYLVRQPLVGPTSREIATPSDRFWDVLTWRAADGPVR